MITEKSLIWKYISNIFIAVDQLGNVLVGGNPDNTISARVGYYNHYHTFENGKVPWYWILFEKIIDFSFYPVDGENHCHEAYHSDPGEFFDNWATNFFMVLAAAIIILSCIGIATILYTLYFLRIVKPKHICRNDYLKKRFNVTLALLKGTNSEIKEHEKDIDFEIARDDFKIVLNEIDNIKGTLGL